MPENNYVHRTYPYRILPTHPHAGSICYLVGESSQSVAIRGNEMLVEIKDTGVRTYVERLFLERVTDPCA